MATVKMLKPLPGDKWHQIIVPASEKDYYISLGWKVADKTAPVQEPVKETVQEKAQEKEEPKQEFRPRKREKEL